MNDELAQAKVFMERGEYSDALQALLPLIEAKDPEAIFLASTFSVGDSESEEDFEVRSFKMLKESAELGFPKAMLALANCYEFGDLVERDKERAAYWFKRVSDLGYVGRDGAE